MRLSATQVRYGLFAVAAVASASVMWWVTREHVTDFYYFVYGGQALIGTMPGYHAGAIHLYATEPQLQIGPLPLLVNAAISWLPVQAEQAVWALLIAACGLVTARSLERLRTHMVGKAPAIRSLLEGLATVGAFSALVWYSHLDDALAITGIAVAASCIASRRPVWLTSGALGMAAGAKPWALVAASLLLVLPRRDLKRAVVVYGVSATIWWLPFVLGDPHTITALGRLPYTVSQYSGLRLLGLQTNHFAPAGIHSLEILLGVALGALAVVRGRWTAAPMAALAARLILEPRFYIYYGAGSVVAALIYDLSRRSRAPWWTLATLTVEFAVYFVGLPPLAVAVGQAALAIAIISSLLSPKPTDATELGTTMNFSRKEPVAA